MPFEIVRNDIVNMQVDAIVNAANASLLGGGGVDGAIHRAAGPELLEACRKLQGCRIGEAKLTPGFRLPCKYVIHTVGPTWRSGYYGEEALLTSCYRESLELARQSGCESIAFPLISAGSYGYPAEDAMRVAMEAIRHFLAQNDMMVYLVVFGPESVRIGSRLSGSVRQYIDDHYAAEHLSANRGNARPYMPQAEEEADRIWEEISMTAPSCMDAEAEACSMPSFMPFSLDEALEELDETFTQMVLRKIDEKGLTDPDCYKRANIDRKLFSKIRKDPYYRPGKRTALALAIALELSLPEAQELLMKALLVD